MHFLVKKWIDMAPKQFDLETYRAADAYFEDKASKPRRSI